MVPARAGKRRIFIGFTTLQEPTECTVNGCRVKARPFPWMKFNTADVAEVPFVLDFVEKAPYLGRGVAHRIVSHYTASMARA